MHRDIKPDNILLDGDTGRAMVTDFGIARAASEEGGGSRLTATGAAIGTPAYMSPEQCVGDRDIDGRSDLYSLGTVAYQMLAGEPPFSGNNTPSIMMKQVTEAPVPLRQRRPDVPEDLERIVMRLLEKDPAERFADGATLVAALDGAPITPPPPPRAAPRTERDGVRHDSEWGMRFANDIVANTLRDIGDRHAVRLSRHESRDVCAAADAASRALCSSGCAASATGSCSYSGTSAMLVGINAMTGHGFWWCVFPILAMGVGLIKEIGGFWADGVPIGSLVTGAIPPDSAPADSVGLVSAPAAHQPPPASVTNAFVAGPHAAVLRQAQSDRRSIDGMVARLSDAERKLLPDVKGTSEALYERIASLAGALSRLDEQVGADRGAALDERIAQIELQSGDTGDRERRLTLLKRQRDMLAELLRSRATLLEQYESAGLLLQNLALDLLKVRSSGLDSALGGITSATQQARALSLEIGYVLTAADELHDIDRG